MVPTFELRIHLFVPPFQDDTVGNVQVLHLTSRLTRTQRLTVGYGVKKEVVYTVRDVRGANFA